MNSLKAKKILLFAPCYFGYEKILAEELEKKGAEVTFVENKPFIHDSINKGTPWYLKFLSQKKEYLQKIILPESKKNYDLFFAVDLFSFHSEIVKNLKSTNPKIKCLLYLWDNIRGYHWEQFFKYFDSILTFDPVEAKQFNLLYWPNFYPRFNDLIKNENNQSAYDVCCIASLQVHRLKALESVLTRDGSQERRKFFYIYQPPLQNKIIYNPLIYNITRLFGNRYIGYHKQYHLIYKKAIHPLVKYEPLPLAETIRIIETSKCVLDLPYPSQTGSTQRVVNALGLGKKVITTNQSIKDEMFYNPEFIKIVSLADFEVDWDWIQKETSSMMNLDYLRIDNWIQKVLS